MLDSRSIHLSWEPVPSALQNGIVRQYKVTILGSFGVQRVINTTNTSVAVTALAPFTLYNLTVAAETIAFGPTTPLLQILTPQDGMYIYLKVQHHVLVLRLSSCLFPLLFQEFIEYIGPEAFNSTVP